MRKLLIIILILTVSILLVSCGADSSEKDTEYRAKVVDSTDDSYKDESTGKYYSTQHLTLVFTEGPFEGQQQEAGVFIDAANYTDIALYKTGDTVLVAVFETAEDEIDYVSVVTLVRLPYIIILALVFLVLIGVIGRMKGLKTILALVFTVSAVVFVLVPLIARGYNPILSAALICVVISVVTLFLVGGFNRKSLSAVLGTVGGLICAAVITIVFSALMRISGINTASVGMLMVADTDVIFNYQGILTAGILIGCIGAVMDVGMSISSSINEMVNIHPAISRKKLFKSGLSVGKDIIGTMANTLILAYTGGSIMLMVVWSVYSTSYLDMLNQGYIVIEVAKSLCGSIGMVMTIPLTAFIASHLVHADHSIGKEKLDDLKAVEEGESQGN
ncbi:MAG: YibE/F family protein [Clostridia bacterium]|jgi:uncharacterized membrane protein|nr:YibE/F family protein [Clostridia bacterium]MBT7122574.1 YibE/F family protein [Clostridia bacterium]